jgi:hypothetical protein
MSKRRPIAKDAISSDATWQPPIQTGAVLPTDMRIKLVRSDNSAFETSLTILFSITLTLFGVFLSPWITSPTQMVLIAKIGTLGFGGLSVLLIIAWAIIKINNAKRGVTVPINLFGSLIQPRQ